LLFFEPAALYAKPVVSNFCNNNSFEITEMNNESDVVWNPEAPATRLFASQKSVVRILVGAIMYFTSCYSKTLTSAILILKKTKPALRLILVKN